MASAWRLVMFIVMGLAGVGVLVALILTLGEANNQRNRASSLQSHSYDVMILARTLSGTIARSEAALGRYVISGDKQLGRLYFEDWRRAKDQLQRLANLTRDNAAQRPMVDRLQSAFDERGEQLSLTALATNYGKNQQALSRYYEARQASALTEINRLLDEVIASERTLLITRTEATMALVERSTRAAFVLSSFGVLLLIGAIILGWLTMRASTDRAIARAEADVAHARADELSIAVAEATEELRAQEARLRQAQKMDAIGQLTGGIAHDFNNMLAVVIGGLELAQRSLASGGPDTSRHLESAREGAVRAAELTRRLLAFAREGAIAPERIHVGTLLTGMRDLLDRTLGDAIQIDIIEHGDEAHVRADRVQFENCILNLAVNARDAMDGRGRVSITSGVERTTAGTFVTIAVRDDGCGMTPDIMERVFEPFFTTKPVGKGTGLGLSQIFSFARQLDGEVAIESTPGAGTTVILRLPQDREADVVAAVDEATTVEIGMAENLTILVVEDDERVLRATVGALEELGHRVIACDDPLRAPALLDDNAPVDLIMSDVLMPVQTGPEMVEALPERHGHIAVLFVTGYAGEASDAAMFGGHHVLRKPFTLAALERSLADAFSRGTAATADRMAAE
ncbi:ATP-binding protein [Sphingomonas sp.]|jgi:signal transduction histidine kinase/ActR/RegA family two-component response regulator|uniref:ATP-binding protein n=1 Tax=Sphingomonas sp. TaxID=28214 RepID=UPI0026335CBE|nr:ATP-binding protein [Sphingomonas sp.]MDF2493069.1 kinase [Sphingomonas sp.]